MTQEENLKAIVNDWWNSLDQFEQGEIIDNNYPDDSHLLDNDEAWNGLDWSIQLGIYEENNPTDFDEEGNYINREPNEPDFDDEYHRKKEEENEPH